MSPSLSTGEMESEALDGGGPGLRRAPDSVLLSRGLRRRCLRRRLRRARKLRPRAPRPRHFDPVRTQPVPADVVSADPDLGGLPVHVAPAQGKQLPLAQAAHRGGQEDRMVGAAEEAGVRVGGPEQRGELGLVEEADLIGLRKGRRVDEGAWVLGAPAAAHPEDVDLVKA